MKTTITLSVVVGLMSCGLTSALVMNRPTMYYTPENGYGAAAALKKEGDLYVKVYPGETKIDALLTKDNVVPGPNGTEGETTDSEGRKCVSYKGVPALKNLDYELVYHLFNRFGGLNLNLQNPEDFKKFRVGKSSSLNNDNANLYYLVAPQDCPVYNITTPYKGVFKTVPPSNESHNTKTGAIEITSDKPIQKIYITPELYRLVNDKYRANAPKSDMGWIWSTTEKSDAECDADSKRLQQAVDANPDYTNNKNAITSWLSNNLKTLADKAKDTASQAGDSAAKVGEQVKNQAKETDQSVRDKIERNTPQSTQSNHSKLGKLFGSNSSKPDSKAEEAKNEAHNAGDHMKEGRDNMADAAKNVGQGVVKGTQAAGHEIEHAAGKTGKGIQRAANKVGDEIKHDAEKTGKAVKKAGRKVKETGEKVVVDKGHNLFADASDRSKLADLSSLDRETTNWNKNPVFIKRKERRHSAPN